MNPKLDETAVRAYRERGFLAPIRVMPEAEARELRTRLEQFERAHGGPLKGDIRHKTHLLFTWLDELIRKPAILDAVEALIGPDILVWNTNFFVKEARDPGFVSWHQDSTYWGLSEPDVVTAWIAFTPSTPESGCMQVIPGSHLRDQLAHIDRYHPQNLLTRGQEIAVEINRAEAVDLVLAPGEMSLHHVRIAHGSEPNRSNDRRIGLAIRYLPTRVRQLAGRDSAMLVRGVDRFGHFDPEPRPAADFDPVAVAAHAAVMKRHTELLMQGSRGGGLQ
jgi:hypothetical protein